MGFRKTSRANLARQGRVFSDAMGATNQKESYILGNGTGRWDDPDDSSRFLARKDDESPVESFPLATNAIVDPWDGCPVYVGWDDGERSIIGMNRAALKTQGINPKRYNPADKRLHGWALKESFSDFSCQAIGTLKNPSTEVIVYDYSYIDETYTFQAFLRTLVDLAPYIPAAGMQRLAMISKKPDRTLMVTTSTAQSVIAPLNATDFQECVAGLYPRAVTVAVWRLADAQTSVTPPDRFMDMRPLFNEMPPRMNYTATTDPDEDNDLTQGYGVQSAWTNIVSGEAFVCVAATMGSAVWKSTTGSAITLVSTDSSVVITEDPDGTFDLSVKAYVDAVAQGLSVKYSVIASTTAPLPANTYANGSSGVGATLTGTATGVLTVDGQVIALNDRVLVKDEVTPSRNGIYMCTTAGAIGVAYVLTRALDMNTAAEIPGAFTFTENGAVNDGAGFVVADPGPFTIGTTGIPWTQFSGAGQIDAGDGLDKTGNRLDVDSTVIRTTGPQTIGAGLTLTAPTIADFSNAAHAHTNATGGGQLTDAALSAPVGVAKGGSGADMSATGGANFLLKQTSVGAVFTAALMALADIPNLLITAAKIADATITLIKLAAGTPGKLLGFDSSGVATELDRAVDDTLATWGETMTLYSLVIRRNSDNKWYKADADDVTRMSDIRGMVIDLGVSAGATNSVGFVRRLGPVTALSGLTSGEPLFASTTAGVSTQTEPSLGIDAGTIIIASYGYATGTTTAFIDTRRPVIYRTHVLSAPGEITTITHHGDPRKARTVRARTYAYDLTLADSYAGTRDLSIDLRGPSGAGAVHIADTNANAAYRIGNAGGNNLRQAQSLTITAGRLDNIQFNMRTSAGTPTGDITVSLRQDNAGSPSATIFWSTTHTPTPNALNAIPLIDGPNLTAGIWWLVFEAAIQTLNNGYVLDGGATSSYAGGVSKADTTTTTFPGTWTVNNAGDLRVRLDTNPNPLADAIAQLIWVTADEVVSSVRLWMKKTGTPTDTLTVDLTQVSGGDPGTTVALGTSVGVPASTLNTSYGWVEFLFPRAIRPSLLTGTFSYFIKLTTNGSASTVNYVSWGADLGGTGSYPPGQAAKVLVSSSWSGTTLFGSPVAIFEIYKQSTRYEERLNEVQWSGPIAGQWAMRYGDAASANLASVTQCKNVGAVNEEIIYDVEVV